MAELEAITPLRPEGYEGQVGPSAPLKTSSISILQSKQYVS